MKSSNSKNDVGNAPIAFQHFVVDDFEPAPLFSFALKVEDSLRMKTRALLMPPFAVQYSTCIALLH